MFRNNNISADNNRNNFRNNYKDNEQEVNMKSLKKVLIEMGATNIRRIEVLEGAFYRYDLNGEEQIIKLCSVKEFKESLKAKAVK